MNDTKQQNAILLEQTQDVQQMFENGLLKKNDQGKYEAVLDPAESEYIKSEVSKTKRKMAMTAVEAEEINRQLERLENQDVEDG